MPQLPYRYFSHLQRPPIYLYASAFQCVHEELPQLSYLKVTYQSCQAVKIKERCREYLLPTKAGWCSPAHSATPVGFLQVAGAAPRPADLRSSGFLWLLGIWITYTWLLQPYAEQLCWQIYTWATCKVLQLKSPGLATPAQGRQARLSCSTLFKAATLSTHSPAPNSVRTQQQQKPVWVCSLVCYNERLHICTQGNTNMGKLSGSQQNHSSTSKN